MPRTDGTRAGYPDAIAIGTRTANRERVERDNVVIWASTAPTATTPIGSGGGTVTSDDTRYGENERAHNIP